MKLKRFFIPSTKLGGWSLGLIIAFFVMFFVFNAIAAFQGPRDDQTPWDNLWRVIPLLLAEAAGIGSFFCGLISIIKSKERALPVFIACSIGLFVLFLAAVEILFPH